MTNRFLVKFGKCNTKFYDFFDFTTSHYVVSAYIICKNEGEISSPKRDLTPLRSSSMVTIHARIKQINSSLFRDDKPVLMTLR